MTYIVMREKGIRTDGYYYESDTTILGVKGSMEKAQDLLQRAVQKYHSDEKPIHGRYNQTGDIEMAFGDSELEDRFWIEDFYQNEERLLE